MSSGLLKPMQMISRYQMIRWFTDLVSLYFRWLTFYSGFGASLHQNHLLQLPADQNSRHIEEVFEAECSSDFTLHESSLTAWVFSSGFRE